MPNENQMAQERRTAYSAGGVIYRSDGAGFEVALIATNSGRRWGLPKGHVRRGEAAEVAAAREIAEETGQSRRDLVLLVQELRALRLHARAGAGRVGS